MRSTLKFIPFKRSAAFVAAVMAILSFSIVSSAAPGSDFTMGNVDRSGSRSIPANAQGVLSKKNVERYGLHVEWTAETDGWVAGAPVTSGEKVFVGDNSGFVYAFDSEDGAVIWKTCVELACPAPGFPFTGVIGSPLIEGNRLYAGTLSGSMVALDATTGQVLWTHTPQVNAPLGPFALDAVYGGPISVRNMVIYALAPNDEFGLGVYARGAVLAVDSTTGQEIWRTTLISDADFLTGSAGAAVWNTTPSYSPELDLVFVGTGQDTNPNGGDAGSDSFFAISASSGAIVWQTQVRSGDTWNVTLPYDPLTPTDTDIGDSPAVFKLKGKLMVAAGDKRGVFWVLDAKTGEILSGLDLFDGALPGPGLTGGFNLDSGFVAQGRDIKHFAVFADQTTSLQAIVDTFPGGTCVAFDPSNPVGCPIFPDSGNLVVLTGDGSAEVCRFSAPSTEIFSPIEMGGMVFVRGAQDGNLYVVDFKTCGLITSLPLPPSYGAQISVAGGAIYTGGGYFGGPGLIKISVDR